MKLKEQNNFVFRVAIEEHGQITGDLWCVCVFIKIHKYMTSSPVWSLNNLLHIVVERGLVCYSFKQVSISKRDAFNLLCNFVS